MPGYPPKPYHDNDDETVDTDADESAVPEAKAPDTSVKRRARLTTVSKAYDLDGDGVLDEAEQAMRDRDAEGRGYLTNEEIYDVVQEQLRAQRSAGYMKKLVAALVCFVVVLALSNLGTSLAAAFLAKDLQAGDDAVMRVAATGEIAAAQSTADVYDAPEMTEDEMDERRRLVEREMEEDPHSHPHRRLRNNRNGGGGDGKKHDNRAWDRDVFDEMEGKCRQQKTVYIKRNWGNADANTCICSRGASVVVREKNDKGKGKGKNKDKDKGKGKGKDKVKVTKVKGKGKEKPEKIVIIENGGKDLVIDCKGKKCYGSGDILARERNEECTHNNECDDGLWCDFEQSLRNARTRRGSRVGRCAVITVDNPTIIFDGAGPGQGCDAGKGRRACGGNDYYCKPRSFDARAFRAANGIGPGGVRAGGLNGMGGVQGQWATISGPSGQINAGVSDGGMMGVGGSARNGGGGLAVYRGPGSCVRKVGPGQSCFNDLDCDGTCLGLGAASSSGGSQGDSGCLKGPSGEICWGMANSGGMDVEGVCSG